MRIVGGKYRSRVLCAFDGEKIRPTADKVRESLFNILRDRIVDSRFLDMFCGTGAMGIEALSRGAKEVVFNDKARDSISLLKKNIDLLKITDGYKILNKDALMLNGAIDGKFDIIYIDPPYKDGLGDGAISVAGTLIDDDGIIIFEDEKPCTKSVDGLIISDTRKYGRVHLTFFKKEQI